MSGLSNLEIDYAEENNNERTNNEHERQLVRPPANIIDVPRFLFASLLLFIHSFLQASSNSVNDISQLTRDTVKYNTEQVQALETLSKDQKVMKSKINETKKAQEEMSHDLADIQQRIDALKERRRIREARMATAGDASNK